MRVVRPVSFQSILKISLQSVCVAVIVAVGFALGKIDGNPATKIILGCVGGASISGVVGAIFRGGKRNKK
jgi:hypothetical protein